MNTIPEKYQGRSLEDLKSSYRAVTNRIDKMHMDAALLTGILPLPEGKRFWTSDEINWDDPKLSGQKKTYFELIGKAYNLRRIIGRLEAEADGTIVEFETGETIYKFLNKNFKTFDEEVEFFRKNNLVRGFSSLLEKCLENPNYLEEVAL